MKGLWVVLEGLTCAGKDTIVKKYLIFHFRAMGIKCEFNAEPNSDNVFGIIARKMVDKQIVLKEEFERAAEKAEVIAEIFLKDKQNPSFWYVARNLLRYLIAAPPHKLNALQFQIPFIADGYEDLREKIIPKLEDGISIFQPRYRMSTIAYSGQPISIVKNFINSSFGTIKKEPDVTYFIKITPETAVQRLKISGKLADKFEKKGESIQKIYYAYEKLLKDSDEKNTVIINGERPMGEVANDIIKDLEKRYGINR